MKKNKLPLILLLAYGALFIWSAIHPFERGVWVAEAITSFVPVVILAGMYAGGTRFSNMAYVMMSILPMLHVIGAHYTFANVPFDWFNHLFGFTRNMYDRVAHMTVGFYAFGISELILLRKLTASKVLACTYALFSIMALAAAYEIFEWQYAVLGDPNAGLAVLGSQGDIWDAQKDMLMDTIGGLVGVILFVCTRKRE